MEHYTTTEMSATAGTNLGNNTDWRRANYKRQYIPSLLTLNFVQKSRPKKKNQNKKIKAKLKNMLYSKTYKL